MLVDREREHLFAPSLLWLVVGLRDAGHNFYTEAGAERLHAALEATRKGRIVVMTAAPAYKCPAAPYEAALLIDAYLRKRGLRDAVPCVCWSLRS